MNPALPSSEQTGAALAVALFLLVVMTLLGLTAIRGSQLALKLQQDQNKRTKDKADDLKAFSDSYSKPLDHEGMRENELVSQMQDQMESTLAELMRFIAEHD